MNLFLTSYMDVLSSGRTLIYSIQTILSILSIRSNQNKSSLHYQVISVLHDILRGVTRENVKRRENRAYRVTPLPPYMPWCSRG